MKRRRLFQYTGLGSLSLLLATHRPGLAAVLEPANRHHDLGLETFEFRVPTVDRTGQVTRQRVHTASFYPERLSRTETLEMVAIASGQFWMGAPRSESKANGDTFARRQIDVAPFFMSKYPVTQGQWAAVAALPKVKRELNPTPSHFQGLARPVESVSWLEAAEFCDRLSQHTGRRYRLPSESQWEYACRAGTHTAFSTGDTITSELADYIGTYTYQAEAAGTYRQATVPVGHFAPNAFGLHDMHGNVWEWCADAWRANGSVQSTLLSSGRSPLRTLRGGSWLDAPAKVRSVSRSGYQEVGLNRTIGFRVSAT